MDDEEDGRLIEEFEIIGDFDERSVAALRLEVQRLVRAYGGKLRELRIEEVQGGVGPVESGGT